ncbi:MAG: hypothetical protein E5V46_00280 [Mesorhizobium sp.]|nr:MAG: hypothetical protein E5V46_00280 [Mesorhizobium sp.]
MNLVSVSQQEIEDRLIDYFSSHFGDDPSVLTPATNIPKTYNINTLGWAAFADALSKLPWMVKLHVRLAQKEMVTVPQIQQLANLIVRKLQNVVAVPTIASEVLTLDSLMKAHEFMEAKVAQKIRETSPKKKPRRAKAKKSAET